LEVLIGLRSSTTPVHSMMARGRQKVDWREGERFHIALWIDKLWHKLPLDTMSDDRSGSRRVATS